MDENGVGKSRVVPTFGSFNIAIIGSSVASTYDAAPEPFPSFERLHGHSMGILLMA